MYNISGRVTAKLSRDGYANTPLSPLAKPQLRVLVPELIVVVAQKVRANQYALVRGADSPAHYFTTYPLKGGSKVM